MTTNKQRSKPFWRRFLTKFFAIILLFFLLLFAFLVWGSGGFKNPGISAGEIYSFGELPTSIPETLRVMTWNIGYGYGVGSTGSGYITKSKDEIDRAIIAIGELIRRDSIDLVLIQEIDFDSKRSGHTDQLKLLAETSGLNFAAQAVGWDARYVPFPYWPPRDHFGRILSGSAVLSRFPIVENIVERLPKPDSNPWFYNMFYLFRLHQIVGIDVGGKTIYVMNSHLESFDKFNRMEQAQLIRERVESYATSREMLLFGGDFNSIPETAEKRADFIDSSEDNYESDNTLSLMRGIEGFTELISPEVYATDPAQWNTYPSDAPTRRLDFIFVNNRFTIIDARVVTEAGTLSDHYPVICRIVGDW